MPSPGRADVVEDGGTPQAAASRPGRLLIAFATISAVVASAALAQAVTLTLFRVPIEWNTGWTPGVFTVVVAAWMAAACKSWASWRRWVALPVAAAVILSVVNMAAPLSSQQMSVEASAPSPSAIDPATVVGSMEFCRVAHTRESDLSQEAAALAINAGSQAGIWWSPDDPSSDPQANAVAADHFASLGGWEVWAAWNDAQEVVEQHCQ